LSLNWIQPNNPLNLLRRVDFFPVHFWGVNSPCYRKKETSRNARGHLLPDLDYAAVLRPDGLIHPAFALPNEPHPAKAGLVLFYRPLSRASSLRSRIKQNPARSAGFVVARPGFEPRQTEPKSVVLPLYYRAIRPHKPAETGKKECKNKLWQSMFQKNFLETSPGRLSPKPPPAQGCRRENSHPPCGISRRRRGRKRRPRNSDKLKQQRHDRVYKGRRKNPLRRLIPTRIDIDRKKQNIQEKTRHRNSRDLRLIVPDKLDEFLKRISRIELDEIVDDKA
jgi:hypothetical protein